MESLEIISFEILRVLFFMSFLGYIIYMITGRKKVVENISTGIFFLSLLALTFNLTIRTFLAGRAPFSNLYESLMSFSWGLVFIYLIVERIYRINILGIVASAMAFISISYASSLSKEIEPLMPALQSHWLTFHVLCFVFAYGAFALSFGCGILYLIFDKYGKKEIEKSENPLSLENIEKAIYKIIAFAFPFMTLGIITGSIWANKAWGSYWSWDPKETWSLITWLVYAAFLHARYHYTWKGRVTAIISIIGFGVVLFTYLGVNFFLPGLHSYAK